MNAYLKVTDAQSATLHGDLTADTVLAVLPHGMDLIRDAGAQWAVDLTGITQMNSVGVALLLEWLRVAKQHQCRLIIQHLPKEARPLLQLCDLEPLLQTLLDE